MLDNCISGTGFNKINLSLLSEIAQEKENSYSVWIWRERIYLQLDLNWEWKNGIMACSKYPFEHLMKINLGKGIIFIWN